jgi:hypothetical protein
MGGAERREAESEEARSEGAARMPSCQKLGTRENSAARHPGCALPAMSSLPNFTKHNPKME